jgi:hypothetical protein
MNKCFLSLGEALCLPVKSKPLTGNNPLGTDLFNRAQVEREFCT